MPSSLVAADIIRLVEAFAPTRLAMPNDPVGLQVGRINRPVRHVVLALDASLPVVEFAVQRQADLLVTHHAMLYRPMGRIDTTTPHGKAVALALAHDLTVYSAHTNLDITEGGVNDVLAERFGLTDVTVLDPQQQTRFLKLVVFVPESHHEGVRAAICDAGAGAIGGYHDCTFQSVGEGTFTPTEGTHPFIGKTGNLERVREIRLETVVPETLTESVVKAMLASHPYEEVAYDLYPLQLTGKVYGLGRIGRLTRSVSLHSFAEQVRVQLNMAHIRFSGSPDLVVERVAVLGGSGGKWAGKARGLGADVLVTSDCDHHTVADALLDGLAIIDATHAAMERPALEALREHLQSKVGQAMTVEVADVVEDPFQWL